MEDEERQRMIELGRAKLAEYLQRKARRDSQKKKTTSNSVSEEAMEDEERQILIELARAKLAEYRQRKARRDSQQKKMTSNSVSAEAMEDEERQILIELARANLAEYRQRKAQRDLQEKKMMTSNSVSAEAMEDEERQILIELARAKYQQRKTQCEAQNVSKNNKMMASSRKHDVAAPHALNTEQSQSDEMFMNSSQRVGSVMTPEFPIVKTLHSGEIIQHDQVFSVEEEEFGVDDSYSEPGARHHQTHREMMENELVGNQPEMEEPSRELEEMRASYGTEGLQQLQEFEAFIKQKDDITQLTSNLQQERREKDDTVKEFLAMTEGENLEIQFQQSQASETPRNSTHSGTAADILQAKQQTVTQQQQLEAEDHLPEDYRTEKEGFKKQIHFWQERITTYEMNDLRLQMEAQCICLSVVYSIHVDQVREYMENESKKALSRLKEEHLSSQEEKIKELQKTHQLELQNIKTQETGDETKPVQVLTGKLRKAISEECSFFTQTFCNFVGEQTPVLKCKVNVEEKESSGVHSSENQELELQDYRREVQDFEENMGTFLNKVMEEHNKLLVLQTRLIKVQGQQIEHGKCECAKDNLPKEETELLSTHFVMTDLHCTDVSNESKLSTLQESEEIKQLKEQVQELEKLPSSLEQQLKGTEENYEAQTDCLQERLQGISESTVQPSDSVVIAESDGQETMYPGGCLKQDLDSTTELSGGEFGVEDETNMVKLLEKPYQELFLEEVAKTTTELIHSSEESGFFRQLEMLGAELAATKEELASYKKKAENLQEELLVKETNTAFLQKDLKQVSDQLTEAKEKLSCFFQKGDEAEVQENRKDCISEPLPIKEGTSSASQTDETLTVNGSSQTPQTWVRNAGVQVDLQSKCSSEEVTKLIGQFTEKIEHMHELHAAEILDVEFRHISETKTLKREHCVAVQLLTEENSVLKAVIAYLKSKQGLSVPELPHYDSDRTREIGSVDPGSDWGHGTYLTQCQGFDSASEGQGGEECESSTDLFPKKVKGLLRAAHSEGMRVLSLSESFCNDGEDHSVQQVSEYWLEERRAYLSTISSLKNLITKMQVQREAEVYDSSQSRENVSDWRGELLLALQQVFSKERDVLLAAFQRELAALGTGDAAGLLHSLEQRIREQGIEYGAAMECLQKADRRSLLSEIQALHAEMNDRKMALKREQENDQACQELLEYNMQQKQSQMLEMQVELSLVKDRAAELEEQLATEKVLVAQLKRELAQTKLELETNPKAQRPKDLEVFRLELKDKAAQVHFLTDTLASEQKKSRELQWALEKEKCKLERNEERSKKELETLKLLLDGQKQRNIQLTQLLEQQTQLLNESQQQIESQRVLHAAQLAGGQAQNLELQALLESKKVQLQELRSTLDKVQEAWAQLQQDSDGGRWPRQPLPSEDHLRELQKELEERHSRTESLNETEKYKLGSSQLRGQMEKDRQDYRKMLQAEQEANTEGQKKMHELQSEVQDLQLQLEEKRQQVYRLDLEGKRLQGIKQEFQKQELERGENQESRRILYRALNKRIYGKHLRTECFRKALIFQKKYLLLLRGGFQARQAAPLALLTQMGRQPAFTELEVITNRPKGFTRFRSTVRVSTAISRFCSYLPPAGMRR